MSEQDYVKLDEYIEKAIPHACHNTLRHLGWRWEPEFDSFAFAPGDYSEYPVQHLPLIGTYESGQWQVQRTVSPTSASDRLMDMAGNPGRDVYGFWPASFVRSSRTTATFPTPETSLR